MLCGDDILESKGYVSQYLATKGKGVLLLRRHGHEILLQ